MCSVFRHTESIEENKRDRLYDCHSKLESKLDDLRSAIDELDLSQKEYGTIDKLIAALQYEMSQLHEEIYYS